MKTIFAEMSHADFYPEDRDDDLIEIVCVAPPDTKVSAGKVVIIDVKEYEELLDYKFIAISNQPPTV